MKVICAAVSRLGVGKKTCQDALMVKAAKIRRHTVVMAVICDGMGGMSRGEVASSRFVRQFETWFYEEMPELFEQFEGTEEIVNKTESIWRKLIAEVNIGLSGYGNLHGIRLGTTAAALFIVDGFYLIMNVGDSRIYLWSDEKNELITRDQTLFQKRLDEGICLNTEDEFKKSGNVLLQCIGIMPVVEPDFRRERLTGNRNCFMLCTDGFWKRQTNREMAEFMKKAGCLPKRMVHCHIKKRISYIASLGEKDDISVATIRLRGR